MSAERHRAIATISICFTLFLNVALLPYRRSSIDDIRSSAEQFRKSDPAHMGTVLLPREAGGDCRQIKFNNWTGTVQEYAIVPCTPDLAARRVSTGDRLVGIQAAFSRN
jgi:hypothetical protein